MHKYIHNPTHKCMSIYIISYINEPMHTCVHIYTLPCTLGLICTYTHTYTGTETYKDAHALVKLLYLSPSLPLTRARVSRPQNSVALTHTRL